MTLYLGAGVSLGNRIPLWEELVTRMYYTALSQERFGEMRPFPNYLYAISEWHLKRRPEPLEITARRVRMHFDSRPDAFMNCIRNTLYRSFTDPLSGKLVAAGTQDLRRQNQTLDAVVKLCEEDVSAPKPFKGVRAVINYNFDDLIETCTPRSSQPLWQTKRDRKRGRTPVYHVHGYVPRTPGGSSIEDMVFTEEQYHAATHDPYSWANMIQIKYLTGSVGLMVGLSLSDRNMRRLLEASRKAKLRSWNFALLQKPTWIEPGAGELEVIHETAKEYLKDFLDSGIKGRYDRFPDMLDIIRSVQRHDEAQQTAILEELGIHPIWYQDHHEIPGLLSQITA